jgi:hypothetical protein
MHLGFMIGNGAGGGGLRLRASDEMRVSFGSAQDENYIINDYK